MPSEPRKLPVRLVVTMWLNDDEQRPIGCCTEDKRKDADYRAAQCFGYSTHDYIPDVPRCKTCDNWELQEWIPGEHFCYSNDSSAFGPDGFCSKHEPRESK